MKENLVEYVWVVFKCIDKKEKVKVFSVREEALLYCMNHRDCKYSFRRKNEWT